jgi:hypothetical protein
VDGICFNTGARKTGVQTGVLAARKSHDHQQPLLLLFAAEGHGELKFY